MTIADLEQDPLGERRRRRLGGLEELLHQLRRRGDAAFGEAGATVLEFEHPPYTREPAQLADFYARLVEARAAC